jgi:uncharacterized protein (DUF3820 family)
MIMPWGKHAGKDLTQIPVHYLCWLTTWDQLQPLLRSEIMNILPSRGLPFKKHAGKPLHKVPREYLLWLQANVKMQDPLPELIKSELLRRHRHQPAKPPRKTTETNIDPLIAIMRRLTKQLNSKRR